MYRPTLLLIALLASSSPLPAAPALNVVAIVTDDQAAWSVGCYGGKEIATPNLDQLADEGARFVNAFVHTPVCSPSRGTYLTGLQSTQLGFTDWLTGGQAKSRGITPATPSWPEVLARNGYATGLVGKWHLGSGDKSLPWNNGLSQFTGNLGGGWAPDKVHFIDEAGDQHSPPGFSVEICTDLAMAFVDEHKDRPFALLIHYREPHAAYVPMPDQDMEVSRNADLQVPNFPGLKQPYTAKTRRAYYASIAAIDRNVGRLLEHLEQAGLADRTLVTFTSDHGYNVGEHGIQHKGNGCWITEDRFRQPRPNMFDTSIRTPLIIRWPGATMPGAVLEDWVTNADMGATVLSMVGVDKPAAALTQSRDYSAVLRGKQLNHQQFPHELFGQYDLVNNPTKRSMRMVRTDQWKLILHLNAPDQNELYDLTADPDEQTNLFGDLEHAGTIRELTGRLRKHMAAIDDPKLSSIK